MRIVEIGCGPEAGPFFDGATEHIITDISAAAVTYAAEMEPRFTPLVADAADLSSLPDNSTDVVLARNVFGDPILGYDIDEYQSRSHSGHNMAEVVELKKLAIMREAARILLTQGRLLIIEQFTPSEAKRFITKVSQSELPLPNGLTIPSPVTLRAVTPERYARHHGRWLPDTWQAVKYIS